MEDFATVDEIIDGIVTSLNSPNYDEKFGIDIGEGLRAYRGSNWVEIKHEEGQSQNIVQREFGRINKVDKRGRKITRYLRKYTLPNLREAVKRCIDELIRLDEKGIKNYTDSRPW